jgi:hypothetical protein
MKTQQEHHNAGAHNIMCRAVATFGSFIHFKLQPQFQKLGSFTEFIAAMMVKNQPFYNFMWYP